LVFSCIRRFLVPPARSPTDMPSSPRPLTQLKRFLWSVGRAARGGLPGVPHAANIAPRIRYCPTHPILPHAADVLHTPSAPPCSDNELVPPGAPKPARQTHPRSCPRPKAARTTPPAANTARRNQPPPPPRAARRNPNNSNISSR
jgi:hypothetical protein